jgi:aspartate/methionine/tyrosine aminotransferase
VVGSEATLYLWLEIPDADATAEAFATRLLEAGIVVSPGSFFGPAGEGYFRMALVPTENDCRRAADLLREAL